MQEPTSQSQIDPPGGGGGRGEIAWLCALAPGAALLLWMLAQFNWAAPLRGLASLGEHEVEWSGFGGAVLANAGAIPRMALMLLPGLALWGLCGERWRSSAAWGAALFLTVPFTQMVFEGVWPGASLAWGLCAVAAAIALMRGASRKSPQGAGRTLRLLPEPGWGGARAQRFLSGGVFFWVICALAAVAALYALAPASESDELRYHLSAPAIWKRRWGMEYLPCQAFSNFPMLGELLYKAMMNNQAGVIDTDGAKLWHALAYGVCIALTGLLARAAAHAARPGCRIRRQLGWGGALAFAALPFGPILAGWGFVDFFMTAYWLAFVYAGCRGLASKRAGFPLLIGAAAGGAIGTKYSMLPQAGLGIAAWLWLDWRVNGGGLKRMAWRAGLIALPAVALSLPWFMRNWINTGNPVYPLAWGVFHGGEWSAQNAAFYMAKAHEKGFFLSGMPALAARPLELLLSPLTTALFFDRFEGHFIGALPFMALCAALGGARRRKTEGGERGGGGSLTQGRLAWLWGMLALSWGLWFFSYQSNRMLLPALGLLFPLAAAGAARLWPELSAKQRRLTGGLYWTATGFGLLVYATMMLAPEARGADRVDAMLTGLGLQNREHYLTRRINYYRAAQWANAHVDSGSKLLLVGEHRTLYFNVKVIVSDWFDTPQPMPWLRASKNNDEMLDRLKQAGVTHILLNAGELKKYLAAYWLSPIGGQPPRVTLDEYARIALEPFRGADGRVRGENALWNSPRLELAFEDAVNETRIYRIKS